MLKFDDTLALGRKARAGFYVGARAHRAIASGSRCRAIPALLERSAAADVELGHPTWGRLQGIDALVAHLDTYRSALPETAVVLLSGLDGHSDVVRYGWDIVDQQGDRVVMEGIDVVEPRTTA